MAEATFEPGSTVLVVSLVSRSDLNGRLGIVINFEYGSGRYGVQINGEQAPVHIKPVNLQAAPQLGSRVMIVSLVNRRDLNGRRGIVHSFNCDTMRFEVRVCRDLDGEETILSLRPENLREVVFSGQNRFFSPQAGDRTINVTMPEGHGQRLSLPANMPLRDVTMQIIDMATRDSPRGFVNAMIHDLFAPGQSFSPLMIASQWKYCNRLGTTLSSDTVGTLLACKADPNLVRKDNKVTALFLAVKYADLTTVDLLLNSHADVAARDCEGRTALHNATDIGDAGILERLLQHGLSVTERENRLNNMDENGNLQLVLMMNPAEKMLFVNNPDLISWKILGRPAEAQQLKAFERILAAGADLANAMHYIEKVVRGDIEIVDGNDYHSIAHMLARAAMGYEWRGQPRVRVLREPRAAPARDAYSVDRRVADELIGVLSAGGGVSKRDMNRSKYRNFLWDPLACLGKDPIGPTTMTDQQLRIECEATGLLTSIEAQEQGKTRHDLEVLLQAHLDRMSANSAEIQQQLVKDQQEIRDGNGETLSVAGVWIETGGGSCVMYRQPLSLTHPSEELSDKVVLESIDKMKLEHEHATSTSPAGNPIDNDRNPTNDPQNFSQMHPPDLGPACIPVMINGVPVYAFLSTTSMFTTISAAFADRVGLAYPEVPAGDPLSKIFRDASQNKITGCRLFGGLVVAVAEGVEVVVPTAVVVGDARWKRGVQLGMDFFRRSAHCHMQLLCMGKMLQLLPGTSAGDVFTFMGESANEEHLREHVRFHSRCGKSAVIQIYHCNDLPEASPPPTFRVQYNARVGQCEWCGLVFPGILRCQVCYEADEPVWYCTSSCQSAHWPEHKQLPQHALKEAGRERKKSQVTD